MNVVEHALDTYLSTERGASDTIAASMNLLPLYRGWTGVIYLTTDGEFLFRDEELDPPQIRRETDEHLRLVALAAGADRFPILANLLPERPAQDDTCKMCVGTGRFFPSNATNWLYGPECHGIGWRVSATAPLTLARLGDARAAYVPFDHAVASFEEFLRKERVPGRVRLVARSDLTVVDRRVYVMSRGLADARSRAARAYDVAMRARLGVGLSVACRLKTGDLVAYVYGPASTDEAIRLMYPDGVRYSVPRDLREGVVAGRLYASVLRWLCRNLKGTCGTQEFLK